MHRGRWTVKLVVFRPQAIRACDHQPHSNVTAVAVKQVDSNNADHTVANDIVNFHGFAFVWVFGKEEAGRSQLNIRLRFFEGIPPIYAWAGSGD